MTSGQSLKWWSSPRTLMRSILMLDDSPHSIALGTAIGMFIGMTPTVGAQMVIVMITAFLTRPLFQFNRVAALITVYISNPITVVPIYYFLYWVGTFFVQGEVQRDAFADVLEYEGFAGWWAAIKALFVDIGMPLLIGTMIIAPLCGLLTYPIMRFILQSFRGDGPSKA